jgi:hypothetical protein
MRAGWGLDPSERADRGSAITRPHKLAHRLVRPVVAVLGAEEFVEELDAGRPVWAENLDLSLPPVVDDLDQAELRDPRGLLPAVSGSLAGVAEVVPDRPLGHAQEVRRLAVGLAALLQNLDRHELLPCELCQGSASERALDVQDQLGKPLANLSMDVQYEGRAERLSGS